MSTVTNVRFDVLEILVATRVGVSCPAHPNIMIYQHDADAEKRAYGKVMKRWKAGVYGHGLMWGDVSAAVEAAIHDLPIGCPMCSERRP